MNIDMETVSKVAVGGALVGVGFSASTHAIEKVERSENDAGLKQIALLSAGIGGGTLAGVIGLTKMLTAVTFGQHATGLVSTAAGLGAMTLMASRGMLSIGE